MLQAASRRGFDFRDADPRDPAWRHRLNLALYGVECAGLVAVHRLRAGRAAGLLGNSELTPASFKQLQEEATGQIERVQALLFPWLGHDPEGRRRQAMGELEKSWAAAWGDPNDPETRARIEATAQWLQSRDRSRIGGN